MSEKPTSSISGNGHSEVHDMHLGSTPDLTPALRALILDELRSQRLTASRRQRIAQYARAMGLSRRQFDRLFHECSQEASGCEAIAQPAKPLWPGLLDWLSNKLRAAFGKTPPRDG